MGIALSACCGFRVFLPLLLSSVAAHWGFIPLQPGMEWLAGWPAMACFATATVLEIGAYYIPFIDNLLDAVATPLAVGAGAVLAVSIFPTGEMEPLWRWGLGILAGGSLAGSIQIGSGILRLLSTKSTAGTGNAVVATGENFAALAGSVAGILVPVLAAAVLLILASWLSLRILGRGFSGKKPK